MKRFALISVGSVCVMAFIACNPSQHARTRRRAKEIHPTKALVELFVKTPVDLVTKTGDGNGAATYRFGRTPEGHQCGVRYALTLEKNATRVEVMVAENMKPVSDGKWSQSGEGIKGIYEEVSGNDGENVTTRGGLALLAKKVEPKIVELEVARAKGAPENSPVEPLKSPGSQLDEHSRLAFMRDGRGVVTTVLAEDFVAKSKLSCELTPGGKAPTLQSTHNERSMDEASVFPTR